MGCIIRTMKETSRWLSEKKNKFLSGYLSNREPGIDGILVTVGLCIIALLLCVVMKDSLSKFIETIVTNLTGKATEILSGVK